jgi:polyferredoxin
MMKRMVVLRRSSQAFFLILFIYILWATTYPLSAAIQPDLIFKADPFIMSMVSISERILLPGAAISLVMILITVIAGRYFCGWVCPLGAAIDITAAVKKEHAILPDKRSTALRKVKFYLLGIFFVLALAGYQAAWIFDPLVIAARFVSLNMIPALTHIFNASFMFLIKYCNAPGAVKDIYYALKPTILGVKVFYFAHSSLIFIFFAAICAASLVLQRFWCRVLCPLGAIYSITGIASPLRRRTDACTTCGNCRNSCRMGAIKEDSSYNQGECILCMDCIYDCPKRATRFEFFASRRAGGKVPEKYKREPSAISRKNFIFLIFSSFFTMGAGFKENGKPGSGAVIRPPAALKEKDFVNRCIRCGNCMKVCITNGLQPVMFQAGLEGIWTPQLAPETGYCEYRCTLCGRTCPTGAIPALDLEQKQRVRLGTALVDRSICLPWAKNMECIVCQEHCPVSEKAIKLDTYAGGPARPYVDEYLCVGCGICQNKCPLRPVRAIRVSTTNANRS